MTPDRDFDKQFASIFGLVNNKHLPTVSTPDPLSADEAEHESREGLFVGVELSESEMAEGDECAERR